MQRKYIKQWFPSHWVSVNKGQWSMRRRKQMREGPEVAPDYSIERVSSPWHRWGKPTWNQADSLIVDVNVRLQGERDSQSSRADYQRGKGYIEKDSVDLRGLLENSAYYWQISGIHSKITKHTMKWENRIHYEEKNQSIETDPELTQMLELTERDIKIIITTFQMFFLKKLEERLTMLNRNLENILKTYTPKLNLEK